MGKNEAPRVQRSTPRGLVDRFGGWLLNLPAETHNYTITQVQIPLRDGVDLTADLYRPILPNPDEHPKGQFLIQGPYGRGLATAVVDGSLWAARGYQVLYVSCRGTFGSGGTLDPGRSEAADGQDVVAWMRTQPWYPGTFATLGSSYMGYTQWALLHDPPADLGAAIISVGPHDYSRQYWGTGAYRLDRIRWAVPMTGPKDASFARRALRLARNGKKLQQVFEGVPLLESVRGFFGSDAPWLEKTIEVSDTQDEHYTPMKHAEALERVNVPVMLNSGWYDLFLYQTIEQYTRLRDRDCDVELTIGPWPHLQASGVKVMPTIYAWAEEHVSKQHKREKKYPVRVFVMGAEEWREMPRWPPATQSTPLYLHPKGRLGAGSPAEGASMSSFIYDPLHPTPTIGGNGLNDGGRKDDSALAARDDVLAFDSEPLAEDLEMMGVPSVELHHTSDTPHVDLFVRLSAVDPQGRSTNLTEGFRRLGPKDTPGVVKLPMGDCAYLFGAGTRIRLLVAGGTFPLYSRNLGAGEAPATGTTVRQARHTIAHEAGAVSVLVLPTCERGRGAGAKAPDPGS